MTTTVWSRKNDGKNKESEKDMDQKWKKALERYRKWTVGRQAKIENFHPTDTVLEEEGGKNGKK
jgi:hypothetical protein